MIKISKKLKNLNEVLTRFLFYTIIFFLTLFNSSSQEIAITFRGDSVILFPNGKWDYYSNYSGNYESEKEISFNKQKFSKPSSSTKKINGANQVYEVWYDDKIWKRIHVSEINEEADIALSLIKGDAYAMVIYEELEIPILNLIDIAIENATNVAPDMEMIDREYRVVNNDTLICMRMDGTTQGMKISYYSYYFSNEKGTMQFHTFTGQNLVEKYKNEIEDLLNGFIAK